MIWAKKGGSVDCDLGEDAFIIRERAADEAPVRHSSVRRRAAIKLPLRSKESFRTGGARMKRHTIISQLQQAAN